MYIRIVRFYLISFKYGDFEILQSGRQNLNVENRIMRKERREIS